MKKLVLIACLFCMLLPGLVQAQIPNNDFETWNTTYYSEPNNWYSGNLKTIQTMNVSPVTRVLGHSGYGVRIETIVIGSDTSNSYITNSDGDPINGQGGVPFSQQATAFTGYYRYSMQGNDTAIMIVIFKKNASIVSMDMFKIRGTGSQPTFAPFSFPLTLAVVPDSVIIAIASSNLISNEGIANGSYLELDGLGFAGASQSLPDGEFENWTTHTSDQVTGWNTYGEGVAKTTDSYTGTYAISLQTIDYGNGQIGGSGITSGHSTNQGTAGGLPYNGTIDTLTGYYKYITSGSDTGMVNVALMQNGNNIGWFGTWLPATNVYTYFEVPIYSGSTPDTMRIDFNSSKWPYSPSSVGSTLFIDNLHLKSQLALGVAQTGNLAAAASYPNPAQDFLNIVLAKKPAGNVLLNIYDISGRMVEQNRFSGSAEQYQVNVADLTQGAYYYEVVSADGRVRNKFVKE